MVFVACQLFCVGSMEHSDSESDFELHEVDRVVDGFSDDFSETSSDRLLQVSDHCGGVEIVPCICSCCVSLCRAEGGTDFGKTPNKPRGV